MTIELPATIDSALCDLNTVRLLRRVDSGKVMTMVEDGQLMWCFDISSRPQVKIRGRIRELRFWFSEVVTPQFTTRLTLREVIDRILPPTRKFFRSGEICRLLLISRPMLKYIARELGAVIHNRVYQVSREAFAAFLTARWVWGNL